MQISLIPVEHINKVWPDIKGFVEQAASYSGGRTEEPDILQDVLSGRSQLWIAFEDKVHGFVTSQFMNYPRMRVLGLQFTGGTNLSLWDSDMWHVLESWARDSQCKKIEGVGRIGWLRHMKKFGCEPAFYTYDKEID